MSGTLIVVGAGWDSDAGVWWVEHSDLTGLSLEAKSLKALREELPGAIEDLIEPTGYSGEDDVSAEIFAHAYMRLCLGAAG